MMKWSHPICHEEVQPSFFCTLQDKVSEGSYVFWPCDVAIPIHPPLTWDTQRSSFHWIIHHLRQDQFLFSPERDVHAPTIVRLEKLTRRCIEIFQFEVTGSFQRHAKPLGMPTPLPEYVLWKASRTCTDVAEVQKLALAVLCQRFLHNERGLSHHLFLLACVCWADKSSVQHKPAVTWPTHPLWILWVGEHIVEAVVNVGHFHSCSKYRKKAT